MVKYTLVDTKQGSRNRLSFTVSSNFGGKDVLEVTLVLNDLAVGNSFYDKHIMRSGEDAHEILTLRNSQRNDSFDSERQSAAHGMGMVLTQGGVPASTIVDLGRIDQKKMIFDFAQALVNAHQAGKFTAKNTNFSVDVQFSTGDCVYTVKRGGGSFHSDGIAVGAQLLADGDDELTFAVNHLEHDL